MTEIYATDLPPGAAVNTVELLMAHFTVAVSASAPMDAAPATMPAAIPSDQAYYWSVPWQRDVRESLEALRTGEFVDFDDAADPNDVARWLLADDDD